MALPWEGESWGKWSQDRSGNGNIKYRNFTTPFGQRSATLSSQMSIYSSKATLVEGCVYLCVWERRFIAVIEFIWQRLLHLAELWCQEGWSLFLTRMCCLWRSRTRGTPQDQKASLVLYWWFWPSAMLKSLFVVMKRWSEFYCCLKTKIFE